MIKHRLISIVMEDGKPIRAYTEYRTALSWTSVHDGEIVSIPMYVSAPHVYRKKGKTNVTKKST